jgi:hypothetical protein
LLYAKYMKNAYFFPLILEGTLSFGGGYIR